MKIAIDVNRNLTLITMVYEVSAHNSTVEIIEVIAAKDNAGKNPDIISRRLFRHWNLCKYFR